ncbi:hypothetical protein HBB16_09535 [Pseudonocardia sp. MCCB 268]|nr:hypothetical protein [Pseudonocardia cytotoxica]
MLSIPFVVVCLTLAVRAYVERYGPISRFRRRRAVDDGASNEVRPASSTSSAGSAPTRALIVLALEVFDASTGAPRRRPTSSPTGSSRPVPRRAPTPANAWRCAWTATAGSICPRSPGCSAADESRPAPGSVS